MDFSVKVTAETGPDHRDGERQTDVASSALVEPQHHHHQQQQSPSQQSGSEGSHPCPACPLVLSSSRELTHHLRGHNSPRSTTDCSGEEVDYACGVCHKVLSSASSLDRHVLVHSGERPFKCKYCDMAFTTNGNMNRHLRTAHRTASPSHSCTDSEASSDSERPLNKRRLIQEEYNNNEIAKRNSPELLVSQAKRHCPDYADEADSQRRHKILLGNARSEIRGGYSDSTPTGHVLGCAVCARQDFATPTQLESHMERHHPDVPAKCESCNVSFKNHRALNLHRFMIHFSEGAKHLRNSVVGFNDLTFVDFSSDKFPTIARAVCEQSLHRPASGEAYQCSKCLRAFPCRSALDAHETDCGSQLSQGSAEQQRLHPDDQSGRNHFFAGLDLQNKAALAEAKEGKDLADIQSIISVTSGPNILQNLNRSDACTPDNCKIKQSFGSSGSSGTPCSESCHEEEAQDATEFATEFRKMKMKGEFPCRLCNSVFPNLRALKGHNRSHMGVGPGMPYPCNMCPYSSTDKTTLIRHLRSHNGDRPYECSLCNYAFTTKANCERHVRNRHGKLSREEIKSVLIYHPSEDSTNDGSLERASPRGSSLVRDEVRKTLVYPSERDELPVVSQYPQAGELRIKDEAKLRQPGLPGLHAIGNHELFPRPPQQPLELTYRSDEQQQQHLPGDEAKDDDLDSRSSDGSVSLVSETKADAAHQRIQASPMDLKKSNSSASQAEDAPLDLSMDVLDLSRKAKAAAAAAAALKADAVNGEDARSQEGSHSKDIYNTTNQLLLTQALLKAGQTQQPSSLEAFYANAQMLYRNFGTFPAAAAGILQPFLYNPHLFGQDYAMKDRMQKELIRGLQTSGGSLVEPPAPSYGAAAFPQQSSRQPDQNNSGYANLMSSAKLMSKNLTPSSRDKSLDSNSQSSNSVKMVIKNGVLMPKQKQRRYRTERPFTCEHCSARFTLRSNMERHIKQQHPQHWSQRPRGGHSTRGRPPANPPTLLQNLGQSASHHHAQQQMSQAYGGLLPKLGQQLAAGDYGKHAISDQVKYAILAQQLKGGNKPEENDSDEELVIDEEMEKEHREPTERTLSLLRGKLEAHIESKGSEDVEMKEVRVKEEFKEKIKQEIESHMEHKNDEHDVLNTKEREDESDEEEDDDEVTSIVPEAMVKTELRDLKEDQEDLASVSEILDNASQHYQHFQSQYMSDEEGLVASTSDCNQSGSDEKSDSVNSANSGHSSSSKKKKKKMKKKKKKKSAYSMAPNRVICPYCERPFPWTSSLRRHILTHTGQKPFQCMHCSLLFTTKSNCDRHLLRKHKNKIEKLRRTRSTSSPELQEPPSINNNSSQFAMRNVPERPYKCNQCPSSTFSTLGNLKKHKSTKHQYQQRHLAPKSRPESPCSEPQHSPQDCSPAQDETQIQDESTPMAQECNVQDCAEPQDCQKQQQGTDQSGYESQSSGVSDNMAENLAERLEGMSSTPIADPAKNSNNNNNNASRKNSPTSSPGPNNSGNSSANNSEAAPFKCHLCDSGFSERNDCLEHIKGNHERSYGMLVAKGALEMDFDGADEPMPPQPPPPPQNPSDGEGRRFPDYSNRKVVCAFCMRRFWSAEDLRRHMRTHTGERPFSCDICCRRFTLKHSMLRHRKKCESCVDSSMYVGTSGDEDTGMSQPPTITPRSQQQSSQMAQQQQRASLPQVASVATADAAPSGLMRFNPYEKLTTLTGKLTAGVSPSIEASDNNDNDLISNLLGIRDKSIIDRVLQASADDAAKLLGVKGNHE